MKNPFLTTTETEEFDRKTFANVLRRAIGGRTQREFAQKCGVNHSYLSRLLNEKLDSRPLPRTLKKIAPFAENHVSYRDLLCAAGYQTERFQEIENTPTEHNLRAVCENIKNLEIACERILATMNSMEYALESACIAVLKRRLPQIVHGRFMPEQVYATLEFMIDQPSEGINRWQFYYANAVTFMNKIGLLATLDFENNIKGKNEHKQLASYVTKISFIFTNADEYQKVLKHTFPMLRIPISAILLDLENPEYVSEAYFATAYPKAVESLPTLKTRKE